MEVDEMIADLVYEAFLRGATFGGVATLLGLGLGSAIDLYKHMGGIR